MTDTMSQAETTARLYLQKVKQLGTAAAARMGQPYDTTDVSLKKAAEVWNERDPEVHEPDVWQQVIRDAAKKLMDDPSLNKEDVLAEMPIQVAAKVYPHRIDILKSMGGTDYAEWADHAEKIEKIAATLREKDPNASTQTSDPGNLPPPTPAAAGVTPPPPSMDAADPNAPPPPMTPPALPSGPPPALPAGPGAGAPMPTAPAAPAPAGPGMPPMLGMGG